MRRVIGYLLLSPFFILAYIYLSKTLGYIFTTLLFIFALGGPSFYFGKLTNKLGALIRKYEIETYIGLYTIGLGYAIFGLFLGWQEFNKSSLIKGLISFVACSIFGIGLTVYGFIKIKSKALSVGPPVDKNEAPNADDGKTNPDANSGLNAGQQ